MNTRGYDEDGTIKKMFDALIEKYGKYWTSIHCLMAIAAILDPPPKMKLLRKCLCVKP
jgi:hypothetical protein